MLSERAEQDRQRILAKCREKKQFVALECGTFCYFPLAQCGGLSSHALRWIADELDRLTEEGERR
jgi:hypothetical protein